MNWWVQLSKAVLRKGPVALLKWEGVSSKEIENGFNKVEKIVKLKCPPSECYRGRVIYRAATYANFFYFSVEIQLPTT